MTRGPELSPIGKIIYVVFRLLWTSLVIVVPTIGVWVASSLAAYRNGPVWLVCLAGLLLFPILPALWDLISELRRRRKAKRWHPRTLTTWDRLILRTLALNLIFLGALLASRPETIFTALSARGDWPLDQARHPLAERARGWIFAAADGLQWLYEASHDNEYDGMIEAGARPSETPTPPPNAEDDPWSDPLGSTPPPVPPPDADAGATSADAKDAKDDAPPPLWPSPAEVHPAVVAMPASAKASVAEVGAYLASAEGDPRARVKAIHDFAATHVAYDYAALNAGLYPDQRAETVLRTGLGVCAGYSNLIKAIGDVTGDEIVVVTGDSRGIGGEISGGGHAWNAAKIDGAWHLLDATWDAGHREGDVFKAEYRTDYLFTPPALMGLSHLPEDPAWQLRAEPLSRGEFTRQPMLRPAFFAEGWSLIDPRRSQITVDSDVVLRIGNHGGRHMMALAVPLGGGRERRCEVAGEAEVQVRCDDLGAGTFNIELLTSPLDHGTFTYVGELQVNVRG
ncbi:MAG: transglutaminase [Myxococcales bacterium]|nr:transglutaminase [Myxococcales bacterium]